MTLRRPTGSSCLRLVTRLGVKDELRFVDDEGDHVLESFRLRVQMLRLSFAGRWKSSSLRPCREQLYLDAPGASQ